ncbi:MAG: exosortase C-terminal domain/associated protein EpsI [Methylomonas sp.]|jgi:EpsI family protein
MITVRKSYWLALMMICTPLLVYVAKPTEKMTDIKIKLNLEQAIPMEFADWKADTKLVKFVNMTTGDNLYDQMLNRTYVNSRGEKIMLAMAYGSQQTHNLKVHPQEVCYKAQGFKIEQLLHTKMDLLSLNVPITQMYATRLDHNEQVTYWFIIGNDVISNYVERFVTVLKYLFSGMIADGYLVRVSTVAPLPADTNYRLQEQFIRDMIAALPEATSKRLLGLE